MIHDAARLPVPATLRTTLCVVGSGPGGAQVAAVAAEAGIDVVVLEAGPLVTPGDMNQREEDMFPRLLWHAGARTTHDRAVRVLQGRGVGGSSLHNINLCKRIPLAIRERWHTRRPLERLSPAAWDALYEEVESALSVSPIEPARWNRHNRLLQEACDRLGWAGGGLSHNRTGCVGSGYCEVGCAYDAKNNALKILLPRAIDRGCVVLTHCQAVRLTRRDGRVTGVEAVALDVRRQPRGRVTIEAEAVCLSASATGTPAILLRSDIADPSETTGRGLRLHPGVMAAGDFAEPVRAWEGIPQSYECTEWLDFAEHAERRAWIVPAFGHPMTVAAMLPGHGAEHRDLIARYAHLAAFSAMLHDHSAGEVAPDGDLDVRMDYWPDEADRRQLMLGLAACVRLLLAAGARRVVVPTTPVRVLRPGDDPDAIAALPLARGDLDLAAAHPMGTVAMADDPRAGAVDSSGRHHHVGGLWVADGSLFPTSIGVPPQISIYALGLHVGRALTATLGAAGG